MFGSEGLDRRLRANGREDRGEEVAVRGGEDARAGAVVFGGDLEFKHRADYNGEGGDWRLEIRGWEDCPST